MSRAPFFDRQIATSKLACLSIVGVWLAVASQASAVPIMIDPGNVGDSFQDKTVSFTDLAGTPVAGQALSVDIIFDDMKHLEINFNDPTPTSYFYNVELRLFHDFAGPLSPSVFPTSFLFDEHGASISLAILGGIGGGAGTLRYFPAFQEDDVDGLIHHGIHFDLTLPSAAGAQLTGGEVRLFITSDQGALTVGEWTAAPEPSAVVLFGAGLLGLIADKRRRRRQGTFNRHGLC